jgi:hypothetical protein
MREVSMSFAGQGYPLMMPSNWTGEAGKFVAKTWALADR